MTTSKIIKTNYDLNEMFRDMAHYLISENYNLAYKRLEILINTKEYRSICVFILFLLNNFLNIPMQYSDVINNTFKLIKFPPNMLYRKVIASALNHKFAYAIKLLNELMDQHGKGTLEEIMLKKLLQRAQVASEINYKKIKYLVINQDYLNLISFLENLKKKKILTKKENYILRLSKDYLRIQNSGVIPTVSLFATTDVFEALDWNNYELALHLLTTFNNNIGFDKEEDILYIISNNLTNLIKNYSGQKPNNSSLKTEEFNTVIDYAFQNDIIILEENTRLKQNLKMHKGLKTFHLFIPFGDGLAILKTERLDKSAEDAYEMAYNYFNEENYEACLKELQKLLSLENPSVKTFILIIETYLKLNDFAKAWDYLQVILYNLEIKNSKECLKELMALETKLIGLVKGEEIDARVCSNLISEINFERESIQYKEEFNLFLTGSSLRTILQNINIKKKEKKLLLLNWAQACFSLQYNVLGEKLLKIVEGLETKNPEINASLIEIRKNRRFYKYR